MACRTGRRRWRATLTMALAGTAATLALGAPAAFGAITISAPPGPAGTDFWGVATPPPADAPRGKVLWVQQRTDAPPGSQGWNVVYVSEIQPGVKQYVSGEFYVPDAPAAGPRDMILWNHETTGLDDSCAPSRRSTVEGVPPVPPHTRIPALTDLLAQGRIVAASDYPGQGLSGKAYYMAGDPNARASLDLLRAVRSLPELNASNRFVQFGWSQGGQTSEHVIGLERGYTPELQALGTGLFAPAVRIRALTLNSMTTPANAGYVITTLRGIQAAYPRLRYRDFLTADGMEVLPALADGCSDIVAAAAGIAKPYKPDAMAASGGWSKAMAAVDDFRLDGSQPYTVYQGDADQAVPVALSRKERVTLCAAGSKVQYTEIHGLDHVGIVPVGAAGFPVWAADRFAGSPAPSNCPAPARTARTKKRR
jgi:hypothetical protein